MLGQRILPMELTWVTPIGSELFLVDSLDEELSEFVPLHETVVIDIDLFEKGDQAVNQVTLLPWVLVRNHLLYQSDKLDQGEAILDFFLLFSEMRS